MAKITPRLPVIDWKNPLAKGLVFDVPMFENGGTIAREIASKISGTFNNSPTWSLDRYGQNLNFAKASTKYIDFGSPAALTLDRNFTILALINMTSHTANNAIISHS